MSPPSIAESISFFFNATTTPEIYTLSLHDALPILTLTLRQLLEAHRAGLESDEPPRIIGALDRKSTRLNSSHPSISYAVFCLKKKNNTDRTTTQHPSHHFSDQLPLYPLLTYFHVPH